MQIIEISPFQAFRRSVATVMQVVPKELRYVTILTLLSGSSPVIAIWLNKVIIDEIIRLLSIGTTQNAIALRLSQPLLLSSIAGSLLVNLVSDAIASINSFVYTSSLRDHRGGDQSCGRGLRRFCPIASLVQHYILYFSDFYSS